MGGGVLHFRKVLWIRPVRDLMSMSMFGPQLVVWEGEGGEGGFLSVVVSPRGSDMGLGSARPGCCRGAV